MWLAFQVAVEVPASKMVVRRGDLAELIVLSDSATFARFRVVREMYIPLQRVWLAEPQERNLEHSIFEQISAEMAALISSAEVSGKKKKKKTKIRYKNPCES